MENKIDKPGSVAGDFKIFLSDNQWIKKTKHK